MFNVWDEDEDLDDIDVSIPQKDEIKLTNAPRPILICLNPYLSAPEKALSIMGRICSAKPSDYIRNWKASINDILFYKAPDDAESTQNESRILPRQNLYEYFKSNRKLFANQDFLYNIRSYIVDLLLAMDRQMQRFTPKTVRVAVGGSFSGGKSTFLNHILNSDGLLPVDVGVSTMVPVMLYCGNFPEGLSVSGVNNLNAIVNLDKDILNCISHSDKSENNISANIATTLQHFIVKIRNSVFEDIVFVDTPGYDNPEDASTRQVTDDEVADKYISMGDVVLWLMPITNGALSQSDIERLLLLGGERKTAKKTKSHIESRKRKIIILITKADLYDYKSRMEVFHKVCDTVSGMEFVNDVVMLSASDPESWEKYWHSRSHSNFESILHAAVSQVPFNYETFHCVKKIEDLFYYEIKAITDIMQTLEDKAQTSKLSCLDIMRKKPIAKRSKDKFFDRNPYLPNEARVLIEKQYTSEINQLDTEYSLHNNNIRQFNKQKKSLEEHKSVLLKWKMDLQNWFESEPIIDYHQMDNQNNDSLAETIRVYFKISRKMKGISCYVHYWNTASGTTWPGLPMTFVESVKGNNIWVADIPKNTIGIVFAIMDENGNICDQSIDFTYDRIKDKSIYYRSRRAGFMTDDLAESKCRKRSNNKYDFVMEGDVHTEGIYDLMTTIDYRSLFTSIYSHDYEKFLKCVSKRCNITSEYDSNGMSIVTAVAHSGFRKALDFIVRLCGAEILNIADKRGFNSFHSACDALKFETCADIIRIDSSLANYNTLDGRRPKDLISPEYSSLFDYVINIINSYDNKSSFDSPTGC